MHSLPIVHVAALGEFERLRAAVVLRLPEAPLAVVLRCQEVHVLWGYGFSNMFTLTFTEIDPPCRVFRRTPGLQGGSWRCLPCGHRSRCSG